MLWRALAFVLLLHGEHALAAENRDADLVFLDEPVDVRSQGGPGGGISAEVDVLTPQGWTNPVRRELNFQEGRAPLLPLQEGIHRVRAPGVDFRFLALTPPGSPGQSVLPRLARKLSEGETVTILAMGDSVTATGPYPELLAKMLKRAFGKAKIRVERRAYPGRSVDASVRRFAQDLEGIRPDLALVMYGLNDQGANVPLVAYLEQQAWLADRLKNDFDCEVVWLEPTPHIDILTPGKDGRLPAESAIFRTITYAAALRDLGRQLGVPVVPTFDALWGTGSADLKSQAAQMWPLFPPHYRKTLESLTETSGNGDTIHPNALGHLLLARAVFDRIFRRGSGEPLTSSATTRWTAGRLETSLEIKNISGERQRGEGRIYPVPQGEGQPAVPYDLAPGEMTEIRFAWPEVRSPEDLLREPLRRIFRFPGPYVQIVFRDASGSRVRAVHAPQQPDNYFPPQRLVVPEGKFDVDLRVDGILRKKPQQIPAGAVVGRMPLREPLLAGGEAVAELSYVRFGSAASGEKTVDGDLGDWKTATWEPLGEPVQARWTNGPADRRENVSDCYLRWSFAAGERGVFFAFRGTCNPDKDTAAVYFDPRDPEQLGTAGPYFWIDLKFSPGGRLAVKAGDSSPPAEGLQGEWRRVGDPVEGEVFVPYEAAGMKAWPKSGDLGVSIVWRNISPKGEPTTLMWAEDGHPWNTRWFGVVRKDPVGPPPFRVRVE